MNTKWTWKKKNWAKLKNSWPVFFSGIEHKQSCKLPLGIKFLNIYKYMNSSVALELIRKCNSLFTLVVPVFPIVFFCSKSPVWLAQPHNSQSVLKNIELSIYICWVYRNSDHTLKNTNTSVKRYQVYSNSLLFHRAARVTLIGLTFSEAVAPSVSWSRALGSRSISAVWGKTLW